MFTTVIFCLGCMDIIWGFLSKSTLFAIVGLVFVAASLLDEFLKPLLLKQITRVLTTLVCVRLMFTILFLKGSLNVSYCYINAA